MIIYKMAATDEMAYYEASHLHLLFLHRYLYQSTVKSVIRLGNNEVLKTLMKT